MPTTDHQSQIAIPSLANHPMVNSSQIRGLETNYPGWTCIREMVVTIKWHSFTEVVSQPFADHVLDKFAEGIGQTEERSGVGIKLDFTSGKHIAVEYEHDIVDCGLLIKPEGL